MNIIISVDNEKDRDRYVVARDIIAKFTGSITSLIISHIFFAKQKLNRNIGRANAQQHFSYSRR